MRICHVYCFVHEVGLDSDSNSFLTSRVPKDSQRPVSCKRSLVLTSSIVVRFLEGVPALLVLDLQRYDCNGTASDSLRCDWGGQVWMVTPYLCRGDLRSRPARSLVYFRPQGRAHSAVSSQDAGPTRRCAALGSCTLSFFPLITVCCVSYSQQLFIA